MKSDKKMAIMITAVLLISTFGLVMPTSADVDGSEAFSEVWAELR